MGALGKRRQVLSFLRYSRGEGGGTVDSTEFQGLLELSKEASQFEGPLIEIGTLFGYSTQALALGKRHDQPLYTVDRFSWNPIGIPSSRHRELTEKNLAFLTRHERVFLMDMENEAFYSQYQGKNPALVFIDAGHSYEACRRDILFATNNEAEIICGDDFSHAGVARAVREAFKESDIELIGDMCVVRRNLISTNPPQAHSVSHHRA